MTTATLVGLCLLALVALIWEVKDAVTAGLRQLQQMTQQLEQISKQLEEMLYQNGRMMAILRGEEAEYDTTLDKLSKSTQA